ncbi:metal ABC transporter solute-binding protein, Zn/Mn family [Lyngbya aestuarii]|uniref:metal ABC transporter solute-binding protein, Zn/Mn family n=1 Tax=Lyngbya aestuarii TaxID=118322 RepID=UPI00403E247D
MNFLNLKILLPISLNKVPSGLFFAIAPALALSLGSCSPQSTSANSENSKQLQVVTTIVPITEFTKAVAGDRAEVTPILPTNLSSHDYQVKPEDARTIAQADVLVKNGLGLETFLADLIANAGNKDLEVIDSSKGIQTISTEEIEGKKHAAGEDYDHQHGELNPHIWLDPQRAIEQVENIRDGLITADPQGQDVYTSNAAAYINKLQELDAEITKALAPYAGKTFVTYHDFGSYFAESYNLKVEYLVGLPEENPSPNDVKRVIDAAQKTNLKTLLTEPQAAGDPFSALAKDLNVRVSNFDSIETSDSQELQPNYYFQVMRQNLKNLETAFSSQSSESFLPTKSLRSRLAFVPQPVELRL